MRCYFSNLRGLKTGDAFEPAVNRLVAGTSCNALGVRELANNDLCRLGTIRRNEVRQGPSRRTPARVYLPMNKHYSVALPTLSVWRGIKLARPPFRPHDTGGHFCNTRVRCRIVSLDRGRLLMKLSKMRWALARLFPANNISSTRCRSLLHFSTL
jgi:hypothetical protein